MAGQSSAATAQPKVVPTGSNSGAALDANGRYDHLGNQCSYGAYIGHKFYEYAAMAEMIWRLASDSAFRNQVVEALSQSAVIRLMSSTANSYATDRIRHDPLMMEMVTGQSSDVVAAAMGLPGARPESDFDLDAINTVHNKIAELNARAGRYEAQKKQAADEIGQWFSEAWAALKSRYNDCGLIYAVSTLATDGGFLIGELAIGLGISAAALKGLRMLKIFAQPLGDGKYRVFIKGEGSVATKHLDFTEEQLAKKYGKPEENHAGVLHKDKNNPVTGGDVAKKETKKNSHDSEETKITQEDYDKLRKKTPSKSVRNHIQGQYPAASKTNPVPDEWLDGHMRTGTIEEDHIVSMKKITQMPGFSQLSNKNKLFVLNNKSYFTGLSRSANGSKQEKTFADWTEHSKSGTKVNPEKRKEFMEKEKELEKEIQEDINRWLRSQVFRDD